MASGKPTLSLSLFFSIKWSILLSSGTVIDTYNKQEYQEFEDILGYRASLRPYSLTFLLKTQGCSALEFQPNLHRLQGSKGYSLEDCTLSSLTILEPDGLASCPWWTHALGKIWKKKSPEFYLKLKILFVIHRLWIQRVELTTRC